MQNNKTPKVPTFSLAFALTAVNRARNVKFGKQTGHKYIHTYSENVLSQGCPTLNGKVPQKSLWAGLRAARVKITITAIPNLLNCVLFKEYT